MKGQRVCGTHGGRSPQAKRSAEQRLQDLQLLAIGVTAKCLRQKSDLRLALRAATEVYDRTGVGAADGYTVADVTALMRVVRSELNAVITDVDARRRFALAMKRRLPSGVLDVEVEAAQPQIAPVQAEAESEWLEL
ncbi:MAG: hypothetical protein ABI603_04260 [Acidobacteriota bacterium]